MSISEIFNKKPRALKPEAGPDIYDQTIGRRKAFARIANSRPTSLTRLTR